MPKKHSSFSKRDALELLEHGFPIEIVHQRSGIPARTLYRWNKKLEKKRQRQLAKKVSDLMAISPHSANPRHKTPNSNKKPTRNQQETNRLCHKTSDLRHKTDDSRQIDDDICHNALAAAAAVPISDLTEPHVIDSHLDDLNYIRAQLMKVARDLASNLDSSGPDINTRSLALSRVLDRVQWLDQLLDTPDPEPEPAAEPAPHNFPGWLRPPPVRTPEEIAAEEAEIARRRVWARSQLGAEDIWKSEPRD